MTELEKEQFDDEIIEKDQVDEEKDQDETLEDEQLDIVTIETEEDYEDYGGSCILSAYIPK
jgi:hypothetical protein